VVLARVGRYHDALSAKSESTDILKQLASREPDLYQGLYRQSVGELQQECGQRGMPMK
jgi:hypothetical protein